MKSVFEVKTGDKVVAKNDFEIKAVGVFVESGDVFTVSDINGRENVTVSFNGEGFDVELGITQSFLFEHFAKVQCHEDDTEHADENELDVDEDGKCDSPILIDKFLPECVTDEMVADILENSEIDTDVVFDNVVVVSCKMPSGYTIVSTCMVDDVNTDIDMCFDQCVEDIRNDIYNLETYHLMRETEEAMSLEQIAMCCTCDEADNCNDAAVLNVVSDDDDDFEDIGQYLEGSVAVIPRIKYSVYDDMVKDI